MYNLATLRSIMSQSSTYFIFKLDIFEWVIFSQFFFLPHPVAYGISVSQPEVKPTPPTVTVQSLNHWPIREVSLHVLKINNICMYLK